MAVTSRSWPDEILHLTREQEREKHDVPWRDGNERERERNDERARGVRICGRGRAEGKKRERGKVQKKKSTTKRRRRRRATDVSRVR